MKTLELSQGKVAIVDDADYGWLSQWKWTAFRAKQPGRWYAVRHSKRSEKVPGKNVFLHRAIMGLEYGDGRQVDHRDADGLNNQRSNLRICTQSQNNGNCRVRTSGKRWSKYKGVSYFINKHTGQQYWIVGCGNRRIGYFHDEKEAARAYNAAAKAYYGEFARLNPV